MSQANITSLIHTRHRRLQKLKEQAALKGSSVDPSISIEIEDIEAEIEQLKQQLLKKCDEPSPLPDLTIPPSEAKGQLILVEDNSAWREEMFECLTKAGYKVRACQSYEKAIEHLAYDKFKVGVLDLSLRGEDSGDLYGLWLLEDVILAHQIPAIIVSGHVYPEMARIAIHELNVFSVLDKANTSMTELVDTVNRAHKFFDQGQYVGVPETKIDHWRQELQELYTKMQSRQIFGGNELIDAMRSTLIQHRRRLTDLLREEELLGPALPEARKLEMKQLQTRIGELGRELLQMNLPQVGAPVKSEAKKSVSQQQLHHKLATFDEEALRNLCFTFEVDYEALQGEGTSGKARELILLFVRRNRLDRLAEAIASSQKAGAAPASLSE